MSKQQPLDLGIIQNFKVQYRKLLVHYVYYNEHGPQLCNRHCQNTGHAVGHKVDGACWNFQHFLRSSYHQYCLRRGGSLC